MSEASEAGQTSERPPVEFYHGYGTFSKGICQVTYSKAFFSILAESPYAEEFFPGTVHFSSDNFIVHCEDEVLRRVTLQASVNAMLNGVQEYLKKLTRYSFEELEIERHRLLDEYRGKKKLLLSLSYIDSKVYTTCRF